MVVAGQDWHQNQIYERLMIGQRESATSNIDQHVQYRLASFIRPFQLPPAILSYCYRNATDHLELMDNLQTALETSTGGAVALPAYGGNDTEATYAQFFNRTRIREESLYAGIGDHIAQGTPIPRTQNFGSMLFMIPISNLSDLLALPDIVTNLMDRLNSLVIDSNGRMNYAPPDWIQLRWYQRPFRTPFDFDAFELYMSRQMATSRPLTPPEVSDYCDRMINWLYGAFQLSDSIDDLKTRITMALDMFAGYVNVKSMWDMARDMGGDPRSQYIVLIDVHVIVAN